MKKLHARDTPHLLIDFENLRHLFRDFRNQWKDEYPNLLQIEKEIIDNTAREIKEPLIIQPAFYIRHALFNND